MKEWYIEFNVGDGLSALFCFSNFPNGFEKSNLLYCIIFFFLLLTFIFLTRYTILDTKLFGYSSKTATSCFLNNICNIKVTLIKTSPNAFNI